MFEEIQLLVQFQPQEIQSIAHKVLNGELLNAAEGLSLYQHQDIAFLGALAHVVKQQKNGNKVFFNRNFHIEPTNLCVFDCKFCSYSRMLKEADDGWVMSKEQMMDIVKSYDGKEVTEVHIVGGVHPKLTLAFFEELLTEIHKHRPELHIKGFTPVEYDYMFRKAKVSYKEGLERLIACGLGSLPGGGAEIFDEDIRNQICADKCTSAEWLELHQTAHELGLKSNATMLYGHIESYEHRIDHMNRLRDLQDKTGGFNTFIPLKFRNKHNQMSDVKESTIIEDLKNYAVSRIYLDNFDHVKAYWPMIGRNTAQIALQFGVDDIDGTIDDTTKIYSMAGSEEQNPSLSTQELVQMIQQVGGSPIERDTLYRELKDYSEVVFENTNVKQYAALNLN
jgi:aminodeoxyfutalosine synthase